MKTSNLEKRLYFLTLYNISPVQAGIQSLHAAIEYSLKYGKDKEYQEWAKKHKTVVILNGGTSNDGQRSVYGMQVQFGSIEQHFMTLKANKIKCVAFYEPDLNNAMSAIAFLVDERVFNRKVYADFDFPKFGEDFYYTFNKTTIDKKYPDYKNLYYLERDFQYKKFKNEVGKDIAFLKEFLKPFKLAQN